MKIIICSFLCITISCGICFATSTQFETKYDIHDFAIRLALLEKTVAQEHHQDSNPSQRRLQILEDELFRHERKFGDTKHCDKRIHSLENTVKELSKELKQQTHNANHIETLEKIVTDQLKTVSELRDEMVYIKNIASSTVLPDVNRTKQDKNNNNKGSKIANRNESVNSDYIRSINSEHDLRESDFIKRQLPVSTVATTTPNQPHTAKIIAFYAYISAITPSITGQSTLVFDDVKTNNGNGFNPSTGVFIAPETGVYVFTWTIREASNCFHSTQLMVNAAEIGIIHLHSVVDGDFVGTGVVVTHVDSGDDVYVRTHASWNHCFIVSNGAGRSSFAGWKLS